MEKLKLSLIVPCYNEEQNVAAFYAATIKAFKGHFENYEMIFVNDGSRDKTWSELKKLYKKDNRIKILNFHEISARKLQCMQVLAKPRVNL